MAEVQTAPASRVIPLSVGGAVLVALTTPLNLVMLLLHWSLIAATAGPYAADNSGFGLILLAGMTNVGLFLVLCGLAVRALRGASTRWREAAVVGVLVLHLTLWLGVSAVLVAHMAATDTWL